MLFYSDSQLDGMSVTSQSMQVFLVEHEIESGFTPGGMVPTCAQKREEVRGN